MQAHVQALYRSVIDDLIGRVKPDFQEAGVDEAVLDELRVRWEAKLSESGALDSPAFREAEAAQRAARALPTALPPPAAQQTGRQPQQHLSALPQRPARAAYAPPPSALGQPLSRLQPGRPMQQAPRPVPTSVLPPQRPGPPGNIPPHLQHYANFLQPPRPAAQQALQARAQPLPGSHPAAHAAAHGPSQLSPTSFPHDVSVQELLKRKREPQDVGAPLQKVAHLADNGHKWQQLPQQDGAGDDSDDSDDLDEANAAKLLADLDKDTAGIEPKEEADTLSDVDLDDEQPDNLATWSSHRIICQFDKVKRTKNKWTCNLKHGIMNIHGQDIIFRTATADLQF